MSTKEEGHMANDSSLSLLLQEIEQSTFCTDHDVPVTASPMSDAYLYWRGKASLRKPKGSGDDSLSKGLF